MSKQCPYCGSFNTESNVSGNIKYGLVQGVRFVTAATSGLTMGIFNHHLAHGAAHSVLHNTEQWGKNIDRHHCCNCGKDFK